MATLTIYVLFAMIRKEREEQIAILKENMEGVMIQNMETNAEAQIAIINLDGSMETLVSRLFVNDLYNFMSVGSLFLLGKMDESEETITMEGEQAPPNESLNLDTDQEEATGYKQRVKRLKMFQPGKATDARKNEDGEFAAKENQTDLFKKEIEDLQEKLRERDSTIARMKEEIGVRTRQTEQLQDRLIEEERRSNQLERKCDRYAKVLEEKLVQICHFEKEQANRNEKIDRLRKELETILIEMNKTKDNLQEKVYMIEEILEYNGRIENEYEGKVEESEVQKFEKEIGFWQKVAMIVKEELKFTKEELQEVNALR
ncbi:tropomyosin Por p 1.0101-like [Palaemon carinicauda]|uniref:tropomyosin Por p 1.0101-like n=1 Tax=Palaemon carinicauda TaxID=392227 RepID=UPI0035B68630